MFSFGLEALFLTITLIAALLGAWVLAPGLGILATIAALPAYATTAVLSHRRASQRAPLFATEKIGIFIIALIVFAMAIIAGIAAFWAIYGMFLASKSGSDWP